MDAASTFTLRIPDDVTARDGWAVGEVEVGAYAAGEGGALQIGLAAGLLVEAARRAASRPAPFTTVQVQRRAAAPIGTTLTTRVRPTGGGLHDAELVDGDDVLVQGQVELAGRDPVHFVPDLIELARADMVEDGVALEHRCDVCGGVADRGIGRTTAWRTHDRVSVPWIPEDELAGQDGELVATLAIAAILECTARWAAGSPPGAAVERLHVRSFRDLPTLTPTRLVGILDQREGSRFEARAAIVDEDEVVHAMASAALA